MCKHKGLEGYSWITEVHSPASKYTKWLLNKSSIPLQNQFIILVLAILPGKPLHKPSALVALSVDVSSVWSVDGSHITPSVLLFSSSIAVKLPSQNGLSPFSWWSHLLHLFQLHFILLNADDQKHAEWSRHQWNLTWSGSLVIVTDSVTPVIQWPFHAPHLHSAFPAHFLLMTSRPAVQFSAVSSQMQAHLVLCIIKFNLDAITSVFKVMLFLPCNIPLL